MTINAASLAALQQIVSEHGPNHNEASSGAAFERELPAKGRAMSRLVAYIEHGTKTGEYQGKAKVEYQTKLCFELRGKNYPPIEHEGKQYPHTIWIWANGAKNYGPFNEKAGAYKLFKQLNYDGAANHFVGLLGKTWLVDVDHYTGKDGKPRATLQNTAKAYTFQAPMVDDPETGEKRLVTVPAQLSPTQVFLWNFCDADQWRSLAAADGGPSWLQRAVVEAENFAGSPAEAVLAEIGVDVEAVRASGKREGEPVASAKVESVEVKAPTKPSAPAKPAAVVDPADLF